jgi:SAM-dependent methyltransferase
MSRINRTIYGKRSTAREWSALANELGLQEGERNILGQIREQIAGAPILDVGVGAGRTTGPMLEISEDYVGVDWSETMIAQCRAKYPDKGRFLVLDARDIKSLDEQRFGFIWFSFNGLDCLDDGERSEFLFQALRVLKPGGLFLFSSHNLSAPREWPWDPNLYLYEWTKGVWIWLRSAARMMTAVCSYFRYSRMQGRGEGYEIRLDTGLNFCSPTYYVDPGRQVADLRGLGFSEVQTMAWSGAAFPPSAPNIKRTIHVYYLARKPVD